MKKKIAFPPSGGGSVAGRVGRDLRGGGCGNMFNDNIYRGISLQLEQKRNNMTI